MLISVHELDIHAGKTLNSLSQIAYFCLSLLPRLRMRVSHPPMILQ